MGEECEDKSNAVHDFTIECFDFDGGIHDDDDMWVPDTPDQENGSPVDNSDWAENEQPTNSGHQQASPPDSPLNTSGTPSSPSTLNSPTSSTIPSTASSCTGHGAPKRYRLLTDMYQNTEEVHIPPQDLMMIHSNDERTLYREASKQREWVEAMDAELASIEKNNTWKLVNLPKNGRAIGLKWV